MPNPSRPLSPVTDHTLACGVLRTISAFCAGSSSRRPHIDVPEPSASAPPSPPGGTADELAPTFGELLGQSPHSRLQRKGSDKSWHRSEQLCLYALPRWSHLCCMLPAPSSRS